MLGFWLSILVRLPRSSLKLGPLHRPGAQSCLALCDSEQFEDAVRPLLPVEKQTSKQEMEASVDSEQDGPTGDVQLGFDEILQGGAVTDWSQLR